MPDPGTERALEEPTSFPGLVASFFTLSGAGFAEPPRNTFADRISS
jgi:hypothetical protein